MPPPHLGLVTQIADFSDRFYLDFIAQGELLTKNALNKSGAPACMHESSLLRIGNNRPKTKGQVLSLDIGGTHTRAAVYTSSEEGEGEWRFLFDLLNSELRGELIEESGIAHFFHVLAHRLRCALELPTAIDGIGVIWSNQIRAQPAPYCKGVGAIITGVAEGSYRKDEWFTADLKDGFDLGTLAYNALCKEGIQPRSLVFSNDTVFTLFSADDCHAGVVIATGANCTQIGVTPAERGIVYNSELGSTYLLKSEWQSEGDLLFVARRGLPLSLEDIIAGAWFPLLVKCHLEVLARTHLAFLPIITALEKGELTLTTQEIVAWSDGIVPHSLRACGLRVEDFAVMTTVVQALIHRAGWGAAGLAYFSLCHQERGGGTLRVAVDSPLARNSKSYLDRMNCGISFLSRTRRSFEAVFIKPVLVEGGAISVPMQGAASAVYQFVDS